MVCPCSQFRAPEEGRRTGPLAGPLLRARGVNALYFDSREIWQVDRARFQMLGISLAGEGLRPGGPVSAERALCIDEDPAQLQVLCKTVQAHDLAPLVARDGAAGLALAAAVLPRLVLVDTMVPGLDAFEVCRRLKADPRTRAIPVIMLTAAGNPMLNAKALHFGADLVLAKPFELDRLTAILRAALALKRGPPAPPQDEPPTA